MTDWCFYVTVELRDGSKRAMIAFDKDMIDVAVSPFGPVAWEKRLLCPDTARGRIRSRGLVVGYVTAQRRSLWDTDLESL